MGKKGEGYSIGGEFIKPRGKGKPKAGGEDLYS